MRTVAVSGSEPSSENPIGPWITPLLFVEHTAKDKGEMAFFLKGDHSRTIEVLFR